MDDWVKAAMSDDSMVAELLTCMKQRQQQSQPSKLLVPFEWGRRKRRTKVLASSAAAATAKVTARFEKKIGDPGRGSPTTPLSFSGGSTGSEDSTRFNGRCVSSNGSKATVLNDSNTKATTSKTSKRKQAFARLKEQENILLEESAHLKKELTTMQTSFVEHRAQNENLKRIKLGFDLKSSSSGTIAFATADRLKDDTVIASTLTSFQPIAGDHLSTSGSSQLSNGESSQRNQGFLLPDLNMLPCEEDSGSETTLYGTS